MGSYKYGGKINILNNCIKRSSIFWDITACSPLKVDRRFEGIHIAFFYLPASFWFLAWFILLPWRRMRDVPPEHQLTFNWIHGIISQKIYPPLWDPENLCTSVSIPWSSSALEVFVYVRMGTGFNWRRIGFYSAPHASYGYPKIFRGKAAGAWILPLKTNAKIKNTSKSS
jgi:hypothetical protein